MSPTSRTSVFLVESVSAPEPGTDAAEGHRVGAFNRLSRSFADVSRNRRVLLFVAILLVAANLRAPVTALPPIIDPIRAVFGLSTTAAGALTTLPLLAFAVLSPFSALFGREYGLERALFGALVAIALGIALRSEGDIGCLYAGTWIIGMGIAVGNVLLPSLVKRDFPDDVASTTSAYMLAMGLTAGVGSALAIPMAHAWGWRATLGALLVLPLAALLAWSFNAGGRTMPARGTATPPHGGAVWHSPVAWHVTLFLGLNSTIYYVAISWLPAILVEDGFSARKAGSLHGLLQLATAVAGPLVWATMKRVRDHRLPAAASAALSALALAGLLAEPALAALWITLFGLGTGAAIILGLTFVGLRTGSASQAAALSGMAQCVGYLLAAIGPMAFGALHDRLNSWFAPMALCVALGALAAISGFQAAGHRQVS